MTGILGSISWRALRYRIWIL